MLHTKDLMIGDWVMTPDGPNQVYKILDNEIWVGDFKASARLFEGDFQPIPLTPEILEKNGFRKLVTYCTEKWVCDNLRLNVYGSGETWRFCADTNRNENSVIYVHFIHELQHALRLCGIEKEIGI